MDLTKILKKGDRVYCTLYGYVEVTTVAESYIRVEGDLVNLFLDSNGRGSKAGECVIFPSKDNRDWSTWKTKKEYPFKPFDKVLVRNNKAQEWKVDFFSHIIQGHIKCIEFFYNQCIPYNKETQHLVGTNQDCPDKYKIW